MRLDLWPWAQKYSFVCFMLVPGFPDGSVAKNLPAMWKMRVQSLGWEDPLEEEMAIHSSILSWKIPWAEDSGRLQSLGPQRVGHG